MGFNSGFKGLMEEVVPATEICNVVVLYKKYLKSYMCIELDQFLDNNTIIVTIFTES